MQLVSSDPGRVVALLLMALLAVLACVSCSENFPMQVMPASFDYYRFQDGRIVEKTVVHEGDPAYDALRRIVNSLRAGWNTDVNTYAPALSFQSQDMIINCRDDIVIVNFRKRGAGAMSQLTNHFSGCRATVLDAINRGEKKRD